MPRTRSAESQGGAAAGKLKTLLADAFANEIRQLGFVLPVLSRGFYPLEGICLLLLMTILINSYLALFNLIPVAPLDGSHVLLDMLDYRTARQVSEFMNQYGILLLFGIVKKNSILQIDQTLSSMGTVYSQLLLMDAKDIDISLSDGVLTIKGEKKEEKEDKGKDYYRMERSYGSFVRTIPLPVEVDTDKVEAKFKKGVLSIALPKTAKAVAETKKISVKVE